MMRMQTQKPVIDRSFEKKRPNQILYSTFMNNRETRQTQTTQTHIYRSHSMSVYICLSGQKLSHANPK